MFSFSNDAAGIGSAFTGIFGALSQGNSDCGSKPIGFNKAKLEAYNECVKNTTEMKYKSEMEATKSKNKTMTISVVVIAVVVILVLFMRKN